MDTFYFSHDYTARSDDKIKQLIRKHGMAGYGIYWAIVEDLYQNANAMRSDCEGIAYDLRVHCDTVKSVLYDFDLFMHEGDKFGSKSVQRRLEQRNNRSTKARESALYRWADANALQTHSERNAIKESKVKENKEKETKEIKSRAAFAAPTLEEVRKYAQGEGIGKLETPEAFHDYYTANGWKVGRNPMKDWKAAYRKWTRQQTPKGLSARTQSDWDALQEWGRDVEQGRVSFHGGFGGPTP